MKRLFIALAGAATLSGCADGPDSFSYAGLNYFNSADGFSGMPLSAASQVPTTGSATYTGRYTVETLIGIDGSGPASMALDFAAGTADLTLTGDVKGVIGGVISGTGVRSNNNLTTSFNGEFYGETGEVIAGTFSQVVTDNLNGAYIVSR